MADLHSIFAYDLPANASLRRIAGDWMEDGYRENLGRPRHCEIVVIDGKGYVVMSSNGYLLRDGADNILPITLDADGTFRVSQGDVRFLPDDGEMARAGIA